MDRTISETEKDPVLSKLKRYILNNTAYKTATDVTPYRKILSDLSISDGNLILEKEHIVLPQSLWKIAVDKAHQGGHPGISRLKRRMRNHFWFPRLNEMAEQKVADCPICQMYTRKTTKEAITPTPLSA